MATPRPAAPVAPAPAPQPGWGAAVSVNRDGSDGERFPLTSEFVTVGRVGADLTFEQLQWQSMSVAGLTAEDAVYPYDFAVAMANVADGAYQFYPRAVDKNGNATPPPASPWCFKKFANAGVDFAFVSTPTPPPAAPDHAAAHGVRRAASLSHRPPSPAGCSQRASR